MVAEITLAGEAEVRLSPLMDALEIPWFVFGHGFESQAIDTAVDKVGET